MDFTQEGALKIGMKYFNKGILEELPCEIKATQKTPWTERLLKIQEGAKKFDEERRRIFHTYLMKRMFLCKISWPNIDQAIALISSRVKDTNKGSWKRLMWAMSFLKGTINVVLMLQADDTNTLTWYIGIAISVHADMESH